MRCPLPPDLPAIPHVKGIGRRWFIVVGCDERQDCPWPPAGTVGTITEVTTSGLPPSFSSVAVKPGILRPRHLHRLVVEDAGDGDRPASCSREVVHRVLEHLAHVGLAELRRLRRHDARVFGEADRDVRGATVPGEVQSPRYSGGTGTTATQGGASTSAPGNGTPRREQAPPIEQTTYNRVRGHVR